VKNILCLLAFSALLNVEYGVARDTGVQLRNPALVNDFYARVHNSLIWVHSEELRKELDTLIHDAPLYGLNTSAYHPDAVSSAITETTHSATIVSIDKQCTDAFLSFCKDVYTGAGAKAMLSYDELSVSDAGKDEAHVMEAASGMRYMSLQEVVKSLEPTDPYYQILKVEVANQHTLHDTAKERQVRAAMSLYRWVHHFKFGDYLLVNIGSATLWHYVHDTVALKSRVIVGKPTKKTPCFSAYCNQVILYPYWNVPEDIAVKEILPKLKKSPEVLEKLDMEVLDKNGTTLDPTAIKWQEYGMDNFPFLLRQSTGCENSLGVIKFNLTDPFDVYLHDTNTRNLFAASARYLSHGCVRVQKAIDLGQQLLDGKLDENYLNKCLDGEKPTMEYLANEVPVFVVYTTVEADSNNVIHYYKDVYHYFK
jgi:L,D-transpeptidase YcbB